MNTMLEEVVKSFIKAVARANSHHTSPKTGMKVPYHGPFASANPSVMHDLLWWTMVMKKHLGEYDEEV